MLSISPLPSALPAYDFTPKAEIAPSAGQLRIGGMEATGDVSRAPDVSITQPPPCSFSDVLGRMVGEVNAKQVAAAETVNALQSGRPVPLHQAVIAMEEASVSFQLMVEVRNKLLESYQELMRMQV